MRSTRWVRTGRRLGPPATVFGGANGRPAAPPPRAWKAPLLRWLGKVGVRLTVAFLVVSLLVPLVGLLAVHEQYVASRRAAQIEAQHVAEPIAYTAARSTRVDDTSQPKLYQQPDRLQRYLGDLHRDLHRDVEILDRDRRILADAIPGHQGEVFSADENGEVEATLRDGRPRGFTERSPDYPHGILQIVIPLRSDGDVIVGAVLLEYTPIYQELLAASAATRRVIVGASVAGLLLALLVALLLARGLVADLRRLARAAGQLAEGDDDARVQVRTSGELGELAAAFNDMAARIAGQKAALTEVAISDPLTGLHNRRAFQARLAEEIQRTRRSGDPFALLMVDLDYFKALNDRHGHPAGDTALVAVATVVRQELRSVDLPARLGGEEFGVLLPGSDQQAALLAAERLRAAIADCTISHDDAILRVTASIGVACYPGHADTDEELLRTADRALYAAKRAGRDRVLCPPDLKPTPERA